MAKFKIEFETKAYITVFVEAENQDEALEAACTETEFSHYASMSGMGSTLAIYGEENSFLLESENLGDRPYEIQEV